MSVPTVELTSPSAARDGGEWSSSARRVHVAALLLVAAHVAVRGLLVAGRNYHGDDFRLLDLANTGALWSWSYLSTDYDGQLMPGALLLAGVVERVAPLEWWAAATTLVVMLALAALALLRLLRLLLGDRPLLLVALAFGLCTPLTLGSTTWWAAALNSLPLQIGLACFLAEAVLLTRTGAHRHAVRGSLVFALTLTFYVKAVLLPWIGFGVVVVLLIPQGGRLPLRAALRRGWSLWLGSAVVTGIWTVAFLGRPGRDPMDSGGLGDVVQTVRAGLRVLASSVLGGPFSWTAGPPSPPMATIQPWAVTAGAGLLAVALVWTCRRSRGAWTVWVLVTAEVTIGLALAGLGRSGLGMGAFAPLGGRYYAAESVLLPVAGALLATLPLRRATLEGGRTVGHRVSRRVAVGWAVATGAFCAVSLVSLVGHARAWQADPAGAYVAAARVSLAGAGQAPMLDQQVPDDVMWSLFYPANQLSTALSPLDDQPAVEAWTTDLRVLDDAGRLRPATVEPGAAVSPGPAPGCGWAVGSSGVTAVGLDASLFAWGWTARVDYAANRDGVLAVRLGGGDVVRAPVSAGRHALYLHLDGGGPVALVEAATPGLELCVAGGIVGNVRVG